MFDPTVQGGTVNERGSSVRRLRAGRYFGGPAGTAPPSAVRCLRPGGISPAGYPGHAAATVSAGGHGPAAHFSVMVML